VPANSTPARWGLGGSFEGCIGTAVPTFTGQLSDPPVQGRFTVKALSDGVCTLKGPMMTGLRTQFGPSACLEINGVLVAVVSGKSQLLDREMLRMLGVQPEGQRIIVVKSSNHFRADFTPMAYLPWKKLAAGVRTRPVG